MSSEKRWRLICYDIREPARYRKVFKLLRGTGESVQYSIFRARLDDRETERLRWEMSKLMAQEDALLIIDLCPRCAANVIARNHVEGWTAEPQPFAIIGSRALKPPAKGRQGPTRARKTSLPSPPEHTELKDKSGGQGSSGA